MRRLLAVAAACAVIGCGAGPSAVDADVAAQKVAAPESFAGVWRSVTPSLEFIGLSIYSTSSRVGVFGARLTYSGLAFEGTGRIDGDSLVVTMATAQSAQSTGFIVARAGDAQTLRVQVHSTAGAPLDLTFVREH